MADVNPTLQTIINKTKSFLRGSNYRDDEQVLTAIRQFMDFNLPYHLDIGIFRTVWSFNTEAGQPNYIIPEKFVTIGKDQIMYVNGYPRSFTSDVADFKSYYKSDYFPEQDIEIGSGNGGVSYNINLPHTQITRGITSPDGYVRARFFLNTKFEDGTFVVAKDDGNGQLIGDNIAENSTINYIDGSISITFNRPILEGELIRATYGTYTGSSPFVALIQNRYVELRPIPDRSYLVEFDAYIKPSTLLNETDILHYEWLFDFITLGAARRIFEELANKVMLDRTEKTFLEYKAMANNRSARQDSKSRKVKSTYTNTVSDYFTY